jgi:hypothetical protein
MAEVHVASSQLDASGRLSVRAGDKLELAPGPDADWMWARYRLCESFMVPKKALFWVAPRAASRLGFR